MNKDAVKAYKASCKEVEKLMKELSEKIANSKPSDLNDVHWGHVGTMNHLKQALEELTSNIH